MDIALCRTGLCFSSVYNLFFNGDEHACWGRAIMILFIPLCDWKNHEGFINAFLIAIGWLLEAEPPASLLLIGS